MILFLSCIIIHTSKVLEIIVLNIYKYIKITSLKGTKYFDTFIDDYSRKINFIKILMCQSSINAFKIKSPFTKFLKSFFIRYYQIYFYLHIPKFSFV